jgi:hypothetical protein
VTILQVQNICKIMLACTMVYRKFNITSTVADFAEQIKNVWQH